MYLVSSTKPKYDRDTIVMKKRSIEFTHLPQILLDEAAQKISSLTVCLLVKLV